MFKSPSSKAGPSPTNSATLSKLTSPAAAPKSKRTLACGSPKPTASKVKLYVVLVVVISAVSVTLLHGAPLNPIPAKIGLFVSDHASNVRVYELPVIISTFWLVLTLQGSPAAVTLKE